MMCHCDSVLEYENCCMKYHKLELTPLTAVALMRSRYAAYVLGELDYLYGTTHPQAREDTLKRAYQSTFDSVQWIDLKVIEVFQGGKNDMIGKVEFEATYVRGSQRSIHHEKSRFKRHQGHWHYLDGEVSDRYVK